MATVTILVCLHVVALALHVDAEKGNCAAEANIFGDPVAADYVFGQPVPTRLVALDTSQQCRLTQQQLEGMRGKGRYGSFLADITGFYLQYHR